MGPSEVAGWLQLPPGERVVSLRDRLNCAGDQPYPWAISYFPHDVAEGTASLQRLVLESRGEHLDRLDRQTLARAISRDATGRSTVRYEHFALAPHEQPALWISDGVAWCHDASGDWRRRCQPLIEEVTDLGTI